MIIIVPLVIIIAVIAWILRPRKSMTMSRKFSILAVIIPSSIVGATALVFQLVYNARENEGVADIANSLFIAGFGIICAAVLASIILAIMRKYEAAKGIGFGICIDVFISVIVLALLEGLAGV